MEFEPKFLRKEKPQMTFVRLFVKTFHLLFISLIICFTFGLLLLRTSPGRTRPTTPSLSRPVLSMNMGAKKFTIAIFSDLHFGEEEHGWGIEQDLNSTHVMRSVLVDERVDLVVLNGDLITGENTLKENSSAYVDEVVKPMLEGNVPWASVYGNHDSKFNLSREAIFKAETGYSLCYTDCMKHSLPGVTNYYIPIHGLDAEPAAILWFFDSRGGSSYQKDATGADDIPNWVAPETAEWFVKTNEELHQKYGRALPSIAFVHIPPHVFLDAQKQGLNPSLFPGLNADTPVSVQGNGENDAEFVKALLETEGLHSIYVGHDHGDSWCSTWPGLALGAEAPFLCFAKHTGYGGYGNWNRGARIVELSFSGGDGDDFMSVDTWVRTEDSEVYTRISLNETYGADLYPTTTGEEL
jgi:predicted MPP superfamily phosphohydrolase